jgi:phage FluMu protein Com
MKMISEDYTEPVIDIDRTKEIRCSNIIQSGRLKGNLCNRKFGIGDIGEGGKLEFMCPRCKQLSRIMKLP